MKYVDTPLKTSKLWQNALALVGFRPKKTAMDFKAQLLKIAEHLDAQQVDDAENILLDIEPQSHSNAERRLILMFWLRVCMQRSIGQPMATDMCRKWFEMLENALAGGELWAVLNFAEKAEPYFGSNVIARTMILALWNRLSNADFGQQYQALSLCFACGDGFVLHSFFDHLLKADARFVPDFWQFQGLARRWSEAGGDIVEDRSVQLLKATNRPDLTALFEIYVKILRQSDIAHAYTSAATLTDATQRQRVAGYLLGASQTSDLMRLAVDLHDALSSPENNSDRSLMQARLAISEGNWAEAITQTAGLMDHPEHRKAAVCLRALALAHGGDHENAQAAIDHVRFTESTPWYLRGRASLIGMTARILRDGESPVQHLPSPNLGLGSGRPLAQSLWVGPKLRWIEQMSMQSYLLNGWRYKLFVYEEPDGVPEGVEICDAAAILPRSAIFREGDASGAHKGSLGAFSDLFRYAMLARVGGLWTDTDVINLRPFDPQGQRIVASEWTDAGIIGPNGAMMAAPAMDRLQLIALRMAEELISDGNLHFARIGPELLAEILGQDGSHRYRILPPHFLNPIGWMETGRLLESFDQTRSLPILAKAHNLHVYTETWRLIGLSLDKPPQGDGFLHVLYDRLMNANSTETRNVMELALL